MLPTPRTVRRAMFGVVAAVAVAGITYLLARFDLETIPAGYTVLAPEVPPGSTAVVDRKFRMSGPLKKGQLVAFRLETTQGMVRRYGRIGATAGARMEDGPELLLDGVESGYPPPAGVELPVEVLPGEILVVTNTAVGDEDSDTRATLIVPEDDVVARVLLALSAP